MKTIINYSKEETRCFEEFPFNDVDSLILSTVSYFNFVGDIPGLFSFGSILLKDVKIDDLDLLVEFLPDKKRYKELLLNLINNPRFNTLKLDNYYEKESKKDDIQFKALTLEYKDFIYVSFMGTKGSSLISWKDDFMMMYKSPLPSQKQAVKYLSKILLESRKDIYVGGHSKGGNLAIYSSMNVLFFQKHRIKKIFSHDGFGFPKKIFDSSKYINLQEKISKTLPSTSVVGLLLYSREEYKPVKSSGSIVNQHSPLNWQVKNGDFVYARDLSWSSKHFDKTISNWINNLDDEKKVVFIDTLYSIFDNDSFNAMDITNRKYITIYKMIKKGLKKVDPEKRKVVIDVFKELAYCEKINILNSDK